MDDLFLDYIKASKAREHDLMNMVPRYTTTWNTPKTRIAGTADAGDRAWRMMVESRLEVLERQRTRDAMAMNDSMIRGRAEQRGDGKWVVSLRLPDGRIFIGEDESQDEAEMKARLSFLRDTMLKLAEEGFDLSDSLDWDRIEEELWNTMSINWVEGPTTEEK